MLRHLLIIASLCLTLAACGVPQRRSGGGAGGGGCAGGDTRACSCEDDADGEQVCRPDGSGWGECSCEVDEGQEGEGEGAQPGPRCQPGSTRPCTCPDDTESEQTCLEHGGAWGGCDCDISGEEGEGEGPAEGEGEGPAEGEGEGPAEGEGEGSAEGEGEEPIVPPDPEDVDLEWGYGFVIDSMELNGNAGYDLDDDGNLDNSLGMAGAFVNPDLQRSLDEGTLLLLLDLRAEDPVDNDPFLMNFYTGTDVDGNPGDNHSGEEEFEVSIDSFREDGSAIIHFGDAVIEDRLLEAETDEFLFVMPGPGGVPLRMTLYHTRLEADVVGDFGELVNGNLGGAVREDDLFAALGEMDLPIDPGMLGALLGPPGLDTDGDGQNDAYSVGMFFTAVSCGFANELGGV